MSENVRNTRFKRNNILYIKIIITIFVMLFNSTNVFTNHIQNKLYLGQSHLTVELNSTEIKPFYIMEDLQNEIWKDVAGYDGLYQISSIGRFRSFAKKKTVTKYGIKNKDGYYVTSMMKKGIRHIVTIHRLVAIHFIPNPENKQCINHKNGIKTDNRVENLEWCTTQENTEHAKINNLILKGENNPKSIFTEEQVREIKRKYKKNVYSQNMLARDYNCSRSAICHIVMGKTWKGI